MKLTTKLIFKLAEIKDTIAVLSNNEKTLVERIKRVMKKKDLDEFGPTDSPQKFVYSQYGKSQVPWKDEYKKLAIAAWGKKNAGRALKKLAKKHKKPCSSLCLERNEKFKPKKRAHNLRKRGKR